jgi:uncharacterized membrane protein
MATSVDPDFPQDIARYDTTRVEAFSDGVFAIAMTALVFDLKNPDHRPGHLLQGLLDQWPAYGSFLASFIYIGVIWMNHHAAFTRICRVDRRLRFANLGVLLQTVLLPFPTAVMSATLQEHNVYDQRIAVALYALFGALLCIAWIAFFHNLVRRPQLVEPDVPERFFHEERKRAGIGVALYAVGGLAGTIAAPWTALVIFVFLPVFFGVTSEGLIEWRGGTRSRGRRRAAPA